MVDGIIKYREVFKSMDARDGLTDYLNSCRKAMIEDPGNIPTERPLSWLVNVRDMDLKSYTTNWQAKGWLHSDDETDFLFDKMKALRDTLAKMPSEDQKALDNMVGDIVMKAKDPLSSNFQSSWFRRKPKYWREPTEIFARTFRNYCALQAGRKLYSDSTTQKEAEKQEHGNLKGYRNQAVGWGFPEVDPDEEMMRYDNNAFRKMLQKHFGYQIYDYVNSSFSSGGTRERS